MLSSDIWIENTGTQEQMMKEFPEVFDGNIKVMGGEQFHIHLTDSTKLFRASTPWAISFVYHEKLTAELLCCVLYIMCIT